MKLRERTLRFFIAWDTGRLWGTWLLMLFLFVALYLWIVPTLYGSDWSQNSIIGKVIFIPVRLIEPALSEQTQEWWARNAALDREIIRNTDPSKKISDQPAAIPKTDSLWSVIVAIRFIGGFVLIPLCAWILVRASSAILTRLIQDEFLTAYGRLRRGFEVTSDSPRRT